MGTVEVTIMKKYIIFILFISQLLWAKTPLESAREKIEILKKQRQEATFAHDYKKALTFFTDDILILPGLQPPIKGKAELIKMFEMDEKNGVIFHAIGNNVEADWLCGEDYYERGTWSMSITSNQSDKPTAFLGSYFQIWEKQHDGSYQIKFNIWNLNHQP